MRISSRPVVGALALCLGSFAALAICTSNALAQEPAGINERIEVDAALHTWDGGFVPSALYGEAPSAEVVQAVKCVLVAVGGQWADFRLQSANVVNAAAAAWGGTRMVLYNPSLMHAMRKRTGNPWAGGSVVAHEVGHHLAGHVISAAGSSPAEELEADELSGRVLKRLGATLDDAQAAMRTVRLAASRTHPSRRARLNAVAKGWNGTDAPAEGARIRDCYRPSGSGSGGGKPGPTRSSGNSAIDFGDDSGPFSRDDACDDSRFTGDPPSYHHWENGYHNMKDATDCRTLFGTGVIEMRPAEAGPVSEPRGTARSVAFGDDSSRWAHDDVCDDSRFDGPPDHYFYWASGEYDMGDASDCRNMFDAGLIELRDGPAATRRYR